MVLHSIAIHTHHNTVRDFRQFSALALRVNEACMHVVECITSMRDAAQSVLLHLCNDEVFLFMYFCGLKELGLFAIAPSTPLWLCISHDRLLTTPRCRCVDTLMCVLLGA